MIFYNIKELERQLRANRLPQKDVFIYFIILMSVSSLSTLTLGSDEPVDAWINNIGVFLEVIIALGFAFHLFNLCKQSDQEKRFLEFYFSLGLVVGIRFLILLFIISFPLGILSLILIPGGIEDFSPIVDLSVTAVLSITYLFLLMRSFNRVLDDK